MLYVSFFLILIVIVLTFIYAYKYKTLSKMSMRNAFRRKMTMLLIVAGSLTGTAFIVGSFAMNDSFQYFMYSGVRKNLGTIDEIVRPKSSYFKPQTLNNLIGALSTSTYVDSILPIAVKETVAAPKGKIRSLEPRAITTVSFIGVDPLKLRQFGVGKDFPNVNLKGNEVVIGQAVADYLKVKVGDTIEALSNPLQMILGTPPTFKIVGVVPQEGVLGYQGIRGLSFPIFVTPEQVKRFFGISQYNQLLISNKGDYLNGVQYTSEVDEAVRKISNDSVKIDNIKKNQIKSISSQQIVKLFILLSSFAIAAGALLIVNIYTMLADERKSSLGTLRAIGFSRRKTGFILYFEGFIYSLIASFVGSFVGLAVAWFMVNEFSGFFSTMTSELSNMFSMQSSNFSFHFNLISLVYGFSLGMIIPLVVLASMALKIGRLNIVKAIRNIPDNPFEKRRMLYFVLFFFVVFIALATFGNMAVDAFVMYTGVIGAVFVFPSFFKKGRVKKYVGNFAALFSIVFSFASNQIPYVQSASENSLWFLGLKSFSILLAALFFLSYNLELFDKVFTKFSISSLRAPFKLALAETSQNKRRTGMTIAMYAIVIFVISLMTIISYSQVVQIQSGERTIFQGYDAVGLPMSGNLKITKADISRMNYVSYYATASMISVRYAINGHSERQVYQMVNANEKFLKGSVLKINHSIPEIKNMNSLWNYLKSHPGSVVSFGLPRVNVGDRVEISREGNFLFNVGSGSSKGMELTFSGPLKNPKKFRVVATFENGGITAFPAGFYTTVETIKNAFGSFKTSNNFFLVKLAGSTETEKSQNFEKFLAFLKTRFSIGIFSKQMINVFSDTAMSFVNIINSFLYFGLSVGIVGLAILILKTLHERRRTIGILKAIGFTKRKVFDSFFIETNFVVILGILSGFFAGWITSYMIYSSLNLGKILVPWGQILGLAFFFYLISILATLLPIRKASNLPPAEVLRYYE